MEPQLKKYLASREAIKSYVELPALSSDCVRGCTADVLIRENQIVVERVIFPANAEIPPHRHPNVAVADFGVSGSGMFHVNGHKFYNDEYWAKRLPLVVPRNYLHGGRVGLYGAVIISFQYWYTEPKESLFFDWSSD
jgi:hypothetical protein